MARERLSSTYVVSFFFFSSRRRHTRCSRDWSSDVCSSDLVVVIGGSQREDDYDKLLARIRAEQLPEDAYSWYLDLRKYGTFVHAGFGLGVERTVAWICGIPHIREAIAFPRTLYKLWP